MDIKIRYIGLAMFFLLIYLVMTPCAFGEKSPDPINDEVEASRPKIAILPLANYAETNEAKRVITEKFYGYCSQKDINVVDSLDLRNTLRNNRIRIPGALSSLDIRAIEKELDVHLLLLGSIDKYRDDENPELGISLRLMRTDDQIIIWAKSIGAEGSGFGGLFDLGRIVSVDTLMDKLIDRLFEDFTIPQVSDGGAISDPPHSLKIAVVPFDNLSSSQYAGDIASVRVISELVRKEYRVIEPSLVESFFRQNQKMPRGGIDIKLAEKINNELGADLLLTGSVNFFQPGSGTTGGPGPVIELSGRYLCSKTGYIIAAYDLTMSGSNSETLLGAKKNYSDGKLISAALSKLLDKLDSGLKKWDTKQVN
ncbi:MAG: hypothetical protein ABIE07_01350 [Candidatus Zixiibacteriota bacterium]